MSPMIIHFLPSFFANAIVDKLLELEIYVSGAGTTDYENMLIELKETLS